MNINKRLINGRENLLKFEESTFCRQKQLFCHIHRKKKRHRSKEKKTSDVFFFLMI